MTESPSEPQPERASPLAHFFFIRPIFGILLTLLLAVSGWLAYGSIVKEAAPDLAMPQATVQTEWPGADPETIEKLVTGEIEKQLKSLKGLKRLRSASFNSLSVIAVEFTAETDLAEAMQSLRDKVRDAEPHLPREAKKPKIEQVSVDDTPIATVALSGEVDMALLGQAAWTLRERLERVPGVKRVDLGGRRKEVVLIQLDPGRLASLGISSTQVRDRIQAAHLDMPWDRLEHDQFGTSLTLYGRFRDVSDLERLPVARLAGGRVVELGEIANIRRDLEREKTRVAFSWMGSPFTQSIDLSIIKIPGVDTLRTVERVRAVLDQAMDSAALPYGVTWQMTSDQSDYIWERLNEVFTNGWQAMLCVFLVLLVLLTWREALVAGLSIPLTFLGALAVVQFLGYSLNELVIIGMVIALGLLVDVFILMMEGMHDGIYVKRLPFAQAALRTVRTYALPAFAGQATTILAMAPLFGIGGIDGAFIRIIPVTAICCLVISLIVALLVDVPLSRYVFPRQMSGVGKSRMDVLTERIAEALSAWSLRTILRGKATALACTGAACALFVLAMAGFSLLPSLLYPKADGRNLGVSVELAPGTTLDTSHQVAGELGEMLRAKPYFESVVRFTGQKSPLSRNSLGEMLLPFEDPNFIGFSCIFKPLNQRDQMAFEYLPELRAELEHALRNTPGATLVLTPQTGGSTTEDPIQVEISGQDMDLLRDMAAQVRDALRAIPGATDVRDNLGPPRLDIKLLPNREALDFFGIDPQDMAAQVRFAMTDEEIGKFPMPGTAEDLEMRMGLAWPSRMGEPGGPTSFEELLMIRPVRPNGETVAALAVLHPLIGQAPQSITHKDARRVVTILARTDQRTVNEILADLRPALEDMHKQWPSGYDYHFAGEAESAAETYASAGKMMALAVFLVFALLAIQFGSFTQPLIIMITLPFGLIGTMGGFFLAWIPFSFPAMIGLIALVGIVVNNAIVMVETMNNHRKDGLSVREAAARGAADRLRPIVGTTLTTVVGLTPLALSNPMWMPLCNAIIFGLIASTVISQLVAPCLYLLLTRDEGPITA